MTGGKERKKPLSMELQIYTKTERAAQEAALQTTFDSLPVSVWTLLAPPAVVNAGGQRSRLLLISCCDKVHLIHSTEGRPHNPVAHNQNFNRASFETATSAKLVSKQVQCERESAAS